MKFIVTVCFMKFVFNMIKKNFLFLAVVFIIITPIIVIILSWIRLGSTLVVGIEIIHRLLVASH